MPKSTTETLPKLTPVLIEDLFYWSKEIGQTFRLSRASLAKLKRENPDDVIRSRRGDMVRGAAMIRFLKSRGNSTEPVPEFARKFRSADL